MKLAKCIIQFTPILALLASCQEINVKTPVSDVSKNKAETKTEVALNKPNIILIQVDDLGYDDLASHGNKAIETPSLDQLAEQSVRFEQFYVSSLCAPSRAALLTGRNFLKTGVSGVHAGRDYINLSETLISDKLQKNGYTTGMWGKWHSGKTDGYLPWDRGFDEAYYASLYNYFDNQGLFNGVELQTNGSATNVITDFAIDFISRNKDKPFFAYIPYMAPHNPWRAPKEIISKYKAKGLSHAMASLYGMIDNLDQNIGRVLQSLDDLNLRDNTIVVFISDNGPWIKSYRFGLTPTEWAARNPNNKRGRKGDNWENGIHSPLFVSWPAKYQPTSNTQLSQIEDLFPTILAWAGIKQDNNVVLDGLSLLQALNGETIADRHMVSAYASPSVADFSYNMLDPNGFYYPLSKDYREKIKFEDQRLAVRFGDFKLIRNEEKSNHTELYNIANDPLEKNNIIKDQPHIAAQLNRYLKNWYKDVLAEPNALQMPVFQIGYNNKDINQIYALSPSETSANLINRDHYLTNWNQVNSWSKYKVKIHRAGIYQVRLMTKMLDPSARTFSLSCNSNTLEAKLGKATTTEISTLIRNESAYWEDFDKPETFKTTIKNFVMGNIQLDKDCTELKLTMTAIETGIKTEMLDQVIALNLVKQE
jgi:arylsulfatase A-like enzyme